MKTTTLIIAGIVAVGLTAWFISRLTRRVATTDDPFVSNILEDIAGRLSESDKSSLQSLEGALIEWHKSGVQPEALRDILKIECSFTKKTANKVDVTVRLAMIVNGEAKVTVFQREVGWETLPQEIRSDFIRNGGKESHFVLCEPSPASVVTSQTGGMS
jgi:hypothetical protein